MVYGCKKDDFNKATYDATIPELVVNSATDGKVFDLDPASNAVVTLEWAPAKASNGTLVFYKVLIDKETGNFSNPVYTGIPNNSGLDNKLAINHRELNKIASAAGIKALEKGKLKWKITATSGVATKDMEGFKTIEVVRPDGYAENPADLYITGTATEGGTDLTKTPKFKKLSEGVFELYTSLSAGTFKLIDKITGTPRVFSIVGKAIKDDTETPTLSQTAKVYRINLDFNKAIASYTEIQSVGLWFSGYNKITNNLVYDGNGVWKAGDIAITWSTQSWGKDERYKFRVTEKDMDGVVSTKSLGGPNADNGNRPTASTAATYYLLKPVDNSQWDYTYKFMKEAAKADVLVKFDATGDYTHQVIYK